MDHILKSRPVVAVVAAIAACTVMVATTVVPPKPTPALASPRVSTQVVQLVASPEALKPAPRTVAAASANQVNIGQVVQNVIGAFIGGIAGSAFLGFLGAGIVASGLIYQIPVVGLGLSPLIPVIAIAGAIVGAPIGVVVGTFYAIKNLVSGLGALPAAASVRPAAASTRAITSPHRSTKSGTRSNRHTAKPSATAKAAVPKQSSVPARAGSGRGHAATSGVKRH